MNQAATLRVISREPELKIVPLEQARTEWDALTGSHPEATLYHRWPWLEVLRRAFGVRPSIAIRGDSDSTRAACLLAQGNPIRRSLISLPFSDFCPPLAVNDSARESLLPGTLISAKDGWVKHSVSTRPLFAAGIAVSMDV